MTIDIAGLFEWVSLPRVYGSIAAELAAIADGTKAMSVFSFGDQAVDADPAYEALIEFGRGLGLSSICHEVDGAIDVFIVREDEGWRVAAYRRLMAVLFQYRWSELSEQIQSSMLGYSAEAFELWWAAWRRSHAAPGAATVYLLLDTDDVAGVRLLGQRAVQPSGGGMLRAFIVRGRVALRHDAIRALPGRVVIARAGVSWTFFATVFGSPVTWADSTALEARIVDIEAFNAALLSNIEMFGIAGWK